MKLLSKLFILVISIGCLQAQELNGAWKKVDEKLADQITIRLYSDAYFTTSTRIESTGEFFGSSGGKWNNENGKHKEMVRFFSKNPDMVGKTLPFDRSIKDGIWSHNSKSSEGEYIKERWKKFK